MSDACFIGKFTSEGISLQAMYEACCEEYRRRLCEMWGMSLDESWWLSGEVGSQLFMCDWWLPLDMQELRYVVENNITFDAWMEYCTFVENEIHEKRKPRINFFSWFMGARPEMLKCNEQV